ncbi:hypothetical protein JHD48_05610 [Sulfurimonas sp. SAG-AH-194-I05]|nr:hypothetical protein [Sulfurimonas sp. SAG-AH-194-I05]MDF1875201.1 hypothetical protein [Sulfurimonas sp. SAG-AH-194-I05]
MKENITYDNVLNILGLYATKQNELFYLHYRKSPALTYANTNIIKAVSLNSTTDDNQAFKYISFFHPLIEEEESCSHLLMLDAIHNYLKHLTHKIFRKFIPPKDERKDYSLSVKYKFTNLLNITSATSYSKNLISFEIDFSNSPKNARVSFKYPLYEMLCTIQNNTIFGIYLEDNEIKLFKQIYENYIITIIDDLFKEPIEIPINNNQYPKFYILMTIKLMLEKFYSINYNIYFIFNFKNKIKIYKNMLSDLNHYTQYDKFTKFDNIYPERDRKIDQETYKNELQIRKESEPNLLVLKDAVMKDKNELITQEEINIRLNKQHLNKYIQKISTLRANTDIAFYIANNEQMNNQAELAEILDMQRLVLNIINGQDGRLWFDTRTKKYSFRSEYNGEIAEHDKKEMTTILNIAMQKNLPKYHNWDTDFLNHVIEVILVESIDDIAKNKNEYNISQVTKVLLFTKAIPTINGDTFNLAFTEEIFQSDTDLLFKRNRFIPSQYLIKRYLQNSQEILGNQKQTFIERFIYFLVEEDPTLFEYIINWIAYYFQNLKKTKTALVLMGDQEVTQNIFWDLIIKEIFGKRYCTTVNDNEYENALVSDIARDKLFFNIGDIDDASTQFDDNTLAVIIKKLLINTSVEDNEDMEVNIHGQMIITAKNPAPYLKKVLSKCTVIEVNNIDAIMQKLDIEDEAELEDAICSDLNNFTNRLANYKIISENAEHRIDTEAREILKGNKSSNVAKDDRDKQLDDFIQAIKDKDINYFEKVYGTKDKKGADVYEHLKYAFNKDDGYFIGQDMYLYYNAINEPPFKTNKPLMDRLKEKDKMFKQDVKVLKILTKDDKEDILFSIPSGGKETGNKDLYKITDYKLAEDIKIPDGATVISSQEKLDKFTFTSKSEEEECIQRTKEYRDKKKKEQEQK